MFKVRTVIGTVFILYCCGVVLSADATATLSTEDEIRAGNALLASFMKLNGGASILQLASLVSDRTCFQRPLSISLSR